MARSPGRSRGSSAPQTPADTISGGGGAPRRAGPPGGAPRRASRRPARTPPAASRTEPRPNAGNGRDDRSGNSSSRASTRASSSNAVRIRIPPTPLGAERHGLLGLLLLPALPPGLPAVAGGGVLARKLDGRDLGVRDGDGPPT